MTTTTQSQATLKGWHVLAILLAFFGSVMTVNFIFVSKAISSFPGEDEAKSYAQGLQFNETLRDRAGQAALGWRAEASLARTSANSELVKVSLFDRGGAPLKGAHVEGVLRRPTDARFDRPLVFTETADGQYTAQVAGLQEGQWSLHARAARGSSHFDLQKQMIWLTPKR